MGNVMAHLAAGRLSPLVDRLLPLSEAAAAHRRLAARSNVGKVVLLPWKSARADS
jgi:NADPH:quinone reductase-like Zn-dependent oxidoreductase